MQQVVQAYLLLSTVETMRGNEEAGKRYLDHAHTMHNGNAMGPEGQLLQGQEQDESHDLVFQIYGQPDHCVGHMGDHFHGSSRCSFSGGGFSCGVILSTSFVLSWRKVTSPRSGFSSHEIMFGYYRECSAFSAKVFFRTGCSIPRVVVDSTSHVFFNRLIAGVFLWSLLLTLP